MKRFRVLALFALITTVISALIAGITPASANTTRLVLSTRTCGTVSAFVVYDSFSEGNPPFFVEFAVDLNGNGVYGEAGEPFQYVRLTANGASQLIGTRLAFKAVPEGSTISVTAFETDSAGVPVSPQISPVSYQCTHRPAKDLLPPNTGIAIPGVGIVAKVNVEAVQVHTTAAFNSPIIGGLARGAVVNVTARNQRGDWIQVQYKGQLGWIMWQTHVILIGPYSTLPVLPNAESAVPTLAATATP